MCYWLCVQHHLSICVFVHPVFPSQALRLPWLWVQFDCKALWESVCLCWTVSWTLTGHLTGAMGSDWTCHPAEGLQVT